MGQKTFNELRRVGAAPTDHGHFHRHEAAS
jgi:hypothetical protein